MLIVKEEIIMLPVAIQNEHTGCMAVRVTYQDGADKVVRVEGAGLETPTLRIKPDGSKVFEQ